MNKITRKFFFLFYLFGALIFFCFSARADTPLEKLEKVGTGPSGSGGAGYAPATDTGIFSNVAGDIIKAFLGLLGIIFIILIIMGGFDWMTAGGDEEKITKAKKTINRAIVGLIITAGSFAIWKLVAGALLG